MGQIIISSSGRISYASEKVPQGAVFVQFDLETEMHFLRQHYLYQIVLKSLCVSCSLSKYVCVCNRPVVSVFVFITKIIEHIGIHLIGYVCCAFDVVWPIHKCLKVPLGAVFGQPTLLDQTNLHYSSFLIILVNLYVYPTRIVVNLYVYPTRIVVNLCF